MPLVAAACLAYAAGLLAGLHALPTGALLVVALLGAAFAAVLRRPALVALVAIAAAGLLVAADARRTDRRCRAQLLGGREGTWTATVTRALGPSKAGRALLHLGRCRVPALVIVRSGAAPVGSVARLQGRAVAGGGLGSRAPARVDRASVTAVSPGPPLLRARARARHAVDRVFRGDAPLAAALLVADAADIPPEVRERFAASGLVHVLSVSGLHVAIVAGAVELLARALRLRARSALLVAAGATLGYVALLGWPPPATRAGIMLAALVVARLRGCPTSPWAPLALGAGVPLLLDPRAVTDLGWQLSVGGVAALVAAGALSRRTSVRELRGWRGALARSFLASTAASLVTAPLVAWHFGQLSLVGPVANLAAGPVVAFLQPALFLALALAPVLPLAHLAADAAHVPLALLDAIAAAAAAVPGASLAVSPTWVGATGCALAAAALVVAATSRHPGRALLAAAVALVVAVWAPLAGRGPGMAELHVLDVGQGDALALRSPAGRWLLLDAGRAWSGGDEGRRTVVPYVRRRGGPVLAFVLSHPDLDHVGGAATVVSALRPREFWDGAYVAGSEAYRAALGAARDVGARWRRVGPGDSVVVDGMTVRVLAPDSAWRARQREANEASVVLLVRYGSVRFLLMGDAEREEELWLVRNDALSLRADVLKVGHHGSRTSSTAPFLAAVRPRVALVSVGAGNVYRHPSAAVVRALDEVGADVLRTDLLGTLVVRTDGRRLFLEADDDRWVLSRD